MLVQGVLYGTFQMLAPYGLAFEPIYEYGCAGHKAGRTVTALKGKVIDKGLLYRREGLQFALVIALFQLKYGAPTVTQILGALKADGITGPHPTKHAHLFSLVTVDPVFEALEPHPGINCAV